MWWDGLFSILSDLFDTKDPRKKDWLLFVLIIGVVIMFVFAPFGYLYFRR